MTSTVVEPALSSSRRKSLRTSLKDGNRNAAGGTESTRAQTSHFEATNDVEDGGAVVNGLAELAERVGHGLHLATIVANREVSLDEAVKLIAG